MKNLSLIQLALCISCLFSNLHAQHITVEPISDTVCIGDTAYFVVEDTSSLSTYYTWQGTQNGGFVNLTDTGSYFGANNDTLSVIVTEENWFQTYRVLLGSDSTGSSFTDTSTEVGFIGEFAFAVLSSDVACYNEPVQFEVTPPLFSNYNWQNGDSGLSTTQNYLTDSAQYVFELIDTVGNGWQGAFINVGVNGVGIVNMTILSGYSRKYGFTFQDEDQIVLTLTGAGNSPEEIGYRIYDEKGDTIYQSPIGLETGHTKKIKVFNPHRSMTVRVKNSLGCEVMGKKEYLRLSNHLNLGGDKEGCPNQSFILDADVHFNEFLWSTGDTTSSVEIKGPGVYSVTAQYDGECPVSDTVHIQPIDGQQVDLGGDILICPGDSLWLNAGSGFESYQWNLGGTDSLFFLQSCSVDTLQLHLYDAFGDGWQGGFFTLFQSGVAVDTFTLSVIDGDTVMYEIISNPSLGSLELIYTPGTFEYENSYALIDADSNVLASEQGGITPGTVWSISCGGSSYWVDVVDSLGCTSSDTLQVDISIPQPDLGANKQLCAGEQIILDAGPGYTYLWSNSDTTSTITADSGTYSVTVYGPSGCNGSDTITITYLPSLAPIDFSDSTICQGDTLIYMVSGFDSVIWSNGSTDTSIEVYQHNQYHLTAYDSNACSMTDTFEISLYHAGLELDSTVHYCVSEPNDTLYTSLSGGIWQGVGITDSIQGIFSPTTAGEGTFFAYYSVSTAGCTTIDSVNLVVSNANDTSRLITICGGDSIFLAGAYQYVTGTYIDTFDVAGICDSVVTTHLFVLDSSLTIMHDTICYGDSILIDSTYQNESGVYNQFFTASNGCDSVIQTILYVDGGPAPIEEISICWGDSIMLFGQYQKTEGLFTDTTTTLNGCDSISRIQLQIDSGYSTNIQVHLCEGDSVFAGGSWQYSSGIYVDTLASVLGCDSVLFTEVEMHSPITIYQTLNICQGDSAYLAGQWQNTAGLYTDSLQTTWGCDSILKTQVIVGTPDTVQTQSFICQGDSIFVGGQWRTTPGIYNDTLNNLFGCDSLIEVTLALLPTSANTQFDSLCQGDSIFVAGSWQYTSGTYKDTLTNQHGCDSIQTSIVEFFGTPNFKLRPDTTLCQGDSVLLTGPSGLTTYQWSPTMQTTSSIWVKDSGMYVLWAENAVGCSNQDSVLISVNTCDTTSIEEFPFNVEITFNNVTNKLNARADQPIESLKIYNTQGSLIQLLPVHTTEVHKILHLTSGAYIVQLEVGGRFYSRRVVVWN